MVNLMKKKVAVAMSGGVDSSITAAILLYRGFEVVGVTMWLEDEEFNEKSCCSSREVQDANAVASQLGIDHYVADFRKIFRTEIENYFVAEYLRGRTPNPCVKCNKKIKFGKLFDFAKFIGADYLATGHYARIVFEDDRFKLKKGIDIKKDQSYVLYNLTVENLSKIIFPLGEMSKSESVDTAGKVLGRHNGVANYTIGQRKGLGIAAECPLYVVRLDVEKHQVIVGKSDELFSDELTAEDVHWIYSPKNFPAKLQAKIRYGFRVADCTVESFDDNLRVKFFEPQRAITKGQSIVFYDGEEVLGGGVIG